VSTNGIVSTTSVAKPARLAHDFRAMKEGVAFLEGLDAPVSVMSWLDRRN
jgi:hypothetical protein